MPARIVHFAGIIPSTGPWETSRGVGFGEGTPSPAKRTILALPQGSRAGAGVLVARARAGRTRRSRPSLRRLAICFSTALCVILILSAITLTGRSGSAFRSSRTISELFRGTPLFPSVNRGSEEATIPIAGEVDLGPVLKCSLDSGAGAPVWERSLRSVRCQDRVSDLRVAGPDLLHRQVVQEIPGCPPYSTPETKSTGK